MALFITATEYTASVGLKMRIDTCLFVFEERNERIYQRLIGAKTIAKKYIQLMNQPDIKGAMVLIMVDLVKAKAMVDAR